MITKELLIKLAKNQAPEAKCITTDINGLICAYSIRPILDTVHENWVENGSPAIPLLLPSEIWRKSLVEIPEEEWHDLIWARDQIFDGKKVCHFGQEPDSYFYARNNVVLERQKGKNKNFASSRFVQGVKWKLYEEPTPKLIKGQRVLVWNHFDKDKRRRYFSHMENGQYQCFADGCDEWSSESMTLPWDHCKAWGNR